MTIGIYEIRNRVNGRYYIGSSMNIEKRTAQHQSLLRCNAHNNSKLQGEWNEYGFLNFSFNKIVVLEKITTRAALLAAEQCYLKECEKDRENSYNLCFSTDGNLTEETVEKIRTKLKGRIFSEEHKRRISKGLIGRYYSDETRRKIGLKTSQRRHTEETKRKIGEASRGHRLTEEVRKRISESQKNRPRTGHPSNKIYRFQKGSGEVFTGRAYDFRKIHGIGASSVSLIIRHGKISCGWRAIDIDRNVAILHP